MLVYGIEPIQGDDGFMWMYDEFALTPAQANDGFRRAMEYMEYDESTWEDTLRGFAEKRAGIDITPGSASFDLLVNDLMFLYDTNMDGTLTTKEAYSELKKDLGLPDYDGITESAFKKV